jgi:hypothetical protein
MRVTPGELYRLLSAEFRAWRASPCSCHMPMVAAREPTAAGAANWGLEPSRPCVRCSPVVAKLVSHYTQVYDMLP